ncbi:hypothetical protein [Bacillus paranthracis]|uniref:hypothetical protein n=1 Tax=Bacillus paranthracis TaxID=2026186 RepID=UPI002812CA17|nr:hypothetical protein [Bacillus paranthracis]MDR0171416.1 hypothetical protein [Bacillus paranthracis]
MNMEWWQSNYQWFLGITVALIATSIAQFFAHRFTVKRDRNTYLRECYQNFYSPILFKVLLFFDVKTAFSKKDMKDDISEEQIFEDILDLFGKNLKYATPNLIAAYEMVKKRDIYDDVSGQRNPLLEIELCFKFLEEVADVSKKLKIKTEAIDLLKYRVLFALWLLLSMFYSCEFGHMAMRFDFEFNDKKLNKRTLKKVKKLLNRNFKTHEEMLLIIGEKLVIKIIEKNYRDVDYNPVILIMIREELGARGFKSKRLEKLFVQN